MKWLKRIRGAIGMGLSWAAGWAVAGVLIGVISIVLPGLPWWDVFFETFDAPLPAMAVPGFFGGMFFSAVLGVAGRHRRFRDLSLPRFAAWGAVGGLLLTLFPFALVAVGLASPAPTFNPWQTISVIGGPFILLSAVSASGSLMLARMAQDRELLEATEDVAVLAEGGAQELPAAGTENFTGFRREREAARPDRVGGTPDA